jgi:hypothetical protein
MWRAVVFRAISCIFLLYLCGGLIRLSSFRYQMVSPFVGDHNPF